MAENNIALNITGAGFNLGSLDGDSASQNHHDEASTSSSLSARLSKSFMKSSTLAGLNKLQWRAAHKQNCESDSCETVMSSSTQSSAPSSNLQANCASHHPHQAFEQDQAQATNHASAQPQSANNAEAKASISSNVTASTRDSSNVLEHVLAQASKASQVSTQENTQAQSQSQDMAQAQYSDQTNAQALSNAPVEGVRLSVANAYAADSHMHTMTSGTHGNASIAHAQTMASDAYAQVNSIAQEHADASVFSAAIPSSAQGTFAAAGAMTSASLGVSDSRTMMVASPRSNIEGALSLVATAVSSKTHSYIPLAAKYRSSFAQDRKSMSCPFFANLDLNAQEISFAQRNSAKSKSAFNQADQGNQANNAAFSQAHQVNQAHQTNQFVEQQDLSANGSGLKGSSIALEASLVPAQANAQFASSAQAQDQWQSSAAAQAHFASPSYSQAKNLGLVDGREPSWAQSAHGMSSKAEQWQGQSSAVPSYKAGRGMVSQGRFLAPKSGRSASVSQAAYGLAEFEQFNHSGTYQEWVSSLTAPKTNRLRKMIKSTAAFFNSPSVKKALSELASSGNNLIKQGAQGTVSNNNELDASRAYASADVAHTAAADYAHVDSNASAHVASNTAAHVASNAAIAADTAYEAGSANSAATSYQAPCADEREQGWSDSVRSNNQNSFVRSQNSHSLDSRSVDGSSIAGRSFAEGNNIGGRSLVVSKNNRPLGQAMVAGHYESMGLAAPILSAQEIDAHTAALRVYTEAQRERLIETVLSDPYYTRFDDTVDIDPYDEDESVDYDDDLAYEQDLVSSDEPSALNTAPSLAQEGLGGAHSSVNASAASLRSSASETFARSSTTASSKSLDQHDELAAVAYELEHNSNTNAQDDDLWAIFKKDRVNSTSRSVSLNESLGNTAKGFNTHRSANDAILAMLSADETFEFNEVSELDLLASSFPKSFDDNAPENQLQDNAAVVEDQVMALGKSLDKRDIFTSSLSEDRAFFEDSMDSVNDLAAQQAEQVSKLNLADRMTYAHEQANATAVTKELSKRRPTASLVKNKVIDVKPIEGSEVVETSFSTDTFDSEAVLDNSTVSQVVTLDLAHDDHQADLSAGAQEQAKACEQVKSQAQVVNSANANAKTKAKANSKASAQAISDAQEQAVAEQGSETLPKRLWQGLLGRSAKANDADSVASKVADNVALKADAVATYKVADKEAAETAIDAKALKKQQAQERLAKAMAGIIEELRADSSEAANDVAQEAVMASEATSALNKVEAVAEKSVNSTVVHSSSMPSQALNDGLEGREVSSLVSELDAAKSMANAQEAIMASKAASAQNKVEAEAEESVNSAVVHSSYMPSQALNDGLEGTEVSSLAADSNAKSLTLEPSSNSVAVDFNEEHTVKVAKQNAEAINAASNAVSSLLGFGALEASVDMSFEQDAMDSAVLEAVEQSKASIKSIKEEAQARENREVRNSLLAQVAQLYSSKAPAKAEENPKDEDFAAQMMKARAMGWEFATVGSARRPR